MCLNGRKPEAVSKKLKALLFGQAGVGKTMAAIQFPWPYVMDTERGAENDQYVKALEKANGAYFFTVDADEMIAEVCQLHSVKHRFKTLVIDPLTIVYNDLLDKSAQQLASKEDPTGTAFSRHKGPADRKLKHLLNLLLRLDMNIIITSHAKAKWARNGREIVEVGQTFDCYPKLDYLFDLTLEIQKQGSRRIAVVRKTRIEAFPDGDLFDFSYDEVAKRYGREILEREAVPVRLATPEQIADLNALLVDRVNGSELKEKWLTAAKAETLSEMPEDAITKCIEYLRNGRPAGKES